MDNQTICAICNKQTTLSLKEKYNEYTLWECFSCKGQFWTPMKNPGAEWYEKDERYSFRNRNPVKKPEVNHREFLKEKLFPNMQKNRNLVPDPPAGGEGLPKLLDIGMGTGHFLAGAVARGYDGHGIDFDHDGINTAKTVFGLKNVEVGDVDFAIKRYGKNFFDAVTLFEVLEHIENPPEFIEKIKLLLKPGGYLGLSVPYRGSWDVFKKYDKPPRHLTRWDKESMKNFLESRGFSIARMKIIPAPFNYLIVKFHFWFRGIFSFGLVEKAAAQTERRGGDASRSSKIKLIRLAAILKNYILFSLPAALLYLYLFVIGRNGSGLYVLARVDSRCKLS